MSESHKKPAATTRKTAGSGSRATTIVRWRSNDEKWAVRRLKPAVLTCDVVRKTKRDGTTPVVR